MKTILRRICYMIYPDTIIRTSIMKKKNNKTILLLGWGGSKPRNLKKLEDFYDSKSINWISFIMPLGTFQFIRNFLIEEVVDIIKLNDQKNLLVHSYSNNGIWGYGELTKRLNNDIIINKLIIDSAPHFIYENVSVIQEANLLTQVMTSIFAQGAYHHPFYSPVINFSLICLGICSRFITKICKIMNIPNHFIPDFIELSLYLRDNVNLVDTLFIYSTGDLLIPPYKIKEFQSYWENRKDKNTLLESYEFGNSIPHTASFYKENEKYKTLICKFFNI